MKFEEKEEQLQEKLDKVNKRFQCLENAAGQGSEVNAEKIEHLSENFISIQTRFEEITNVMDNVLERLHEFELQRRNNLLFYGVPEEQNESSVKLLGKIREVIRSQFGVQVGFLSSPGPKPLAPNPFVPKPKPRGLGLTLNCSRPPPPPTHPPPTP